MPDKNWRAKDPEAARAMDRAYYQRNREEILKRRAIARAKKKAEDGPGPRTGRYEEYLVDIVWAQGPPFDFEVLSPSEKAEICRRWHRSGRSLNELARLTGWQPSRYFRVSETNHQHQEAA